MTNEHVCNHGRGCAGEGVCLCSCHATVQSGRRSELYCATCDVVLIDSLIERAPRGAMQIRTHKDTFGLTHDVRMRPVTIKREAK